MRRALLDILCCPVCKGDFEIRPAEEEAGEILEGGLYCARCVAEYPIHDGIPDLIPKKGDGSERE